MNLLILGGPGFLGRHLIEAALARHHQVTVFNRGRTHPDLFPEVEKLRGDRDGDLRALEGRKWDAAIDTSGMISANVRATAALLAGSVAHYTFVSSISVYRDFSRSGLLESAPVAELPAGVGEDANQADTYGARKALCEQAAEAAMPGRVLNVRAGVIVGPHDSSGRFLYWVRRAAAGGELLAPGDPRAPVQLIDARDLAEWMVRMAESRTAGVFNATGPPSLLTFQQMIEHCRAAVHGEVRITWVDEPFLLKHGVAPFTDLPFWLPSPAWCGFFSVDCRRAYAAGLVCRPLTESANDLFAWDRAAAVGSAGGLMRERERELLRLWKYRFVGGQEETAASG